MAWIWGANVRSILIFNSFDVDGLEIAMDFDNMGLPIQDHLSWFFFMLAEA
ncbi:predicted protein [Sclerotinia sclerotiorum 1980 UF-70]|uniref:Uncharacterized protein n=2 Tax=Sclerotinia sclerotiorum (strain ATCC 18683 / 1980 / Ss-1) TaxID=665079 RepID=A7ELC3_SCLS1|nr:predicted protein [Sclerotinia sclerotiorum 1980 UF-70]APA09702.1 hypothetical protein sscle_05g044720 [Sclerotinia sclerotiorum 1980 UF-70]EDO03639.1 predicted protein [Sclerotinia sclerotiorum 1980 UF-70]